MSARRSEPVDARLHAVRTLAALLVRHGPRNPEPPPASDAALTPANDAGPAHQPHAKAA